MRDHYEVLQVHRSAEADVIRAAYRVLARKYHPDHGGDAKRMIALNDAWDVLGDPERRAEYDRLLAQAAARPAPPSWPPTPSAPTRPPAADSAATAAGASYAGTASAAGQSASGSATDINRAGPPPGRPSGTVLDFGRYAGWSLGEIARQDLDYLEWLQRSPSGRRLRAELETLLRGRRGAGPAGSQGLPRR